MESFIGTFTSLLYVTIIYLCNAPAVESNSHVEVRAVFLKCEPDDRQALSLDNEINRFEREELYKHSALHDCSKKIAVTVKVANEPDMSLDDEYIPIDHVLLGSKRIRLLDPYVMRMRREQPLQAYKLKKVDTVNGILQYTEDNISRAQRSSYTSTIQPHMDYFNSSYSSHYGLEHEAGSTKEVVRNYDLPLKYSDNLMGTNSCYTNKRIKRNEHNVLIENTNEGKIPKIASDNTLGKKEDVSEMNIYKESLNDKHRYTEKHDHFDRNEATSDDSKTDIHSRKQPTIESDISLRSKDDDVIRNSKNKQENSMNLDRQGDELSRTKKHYKSIKNSKSEQELVVYEIDSPDIWSTVHIQLFEKLSTPDGKTVWNDLSKGEAASVSSLAPEWSDQDLNLRYRAEWVPRENFTLPTSRMCLLAPQDKYDTRDSDEEKYTPLKNGDYIVVPKDDIVTLDKTKPDTSQQSENYSDVPANKFRKVMVRMSRAIIDSKADKMNIDTHRGDHYLTIPYERPHQAQIDLEARADENQLVNIGSSGRIMTIVSDNTRRTRTVINVQIMNTGLMASHFSVKPRDCGPETPSDDDESAEKPILLPPRHTRYVRLDLPNEIPSDSTRCSVSLVSGDGDSVAVRDVTIKRGDRCYCVWHCECVCLSDDPKLLCEEMPDTRQVAAGLSLRERPRHARSICYRDAPSVNVIVTAFGVLFVLLCLGIIKAILGLVFRCIGSWGLHRIVQMPRQLSRYYENSLKDFPVEYDKEGWPVHPVSKKRTVRLVSKSMEFLLNLIFFIVMPCRVVYDIVKQIFDSICKRKERKIDHSLIKNQENYDTDFPSGESQDMQASNIRRKRRRRRRRNRLRRWMTNEAEELSTFLWQRSLLVEQTSISSSMRALIHEDKGKMVKQEPLNSDEDDTEFVITQMEKSRESLAKSQKSQTGLTGQHSNNQ